MLSAYQQCLAFPFFLDTGATRHPSWTVPVDALPGLRGRAGGQERS